MEIEENVPIVVFDNRCYLCIKFARMVDFLSRGKITMVGHYSEFGEKIRREILDESALEMFWFINKRRAYGGRAALLPVIKSIFLKKGKKNSFSVKNEACTQECKNVKAAFLRSSSLLTNSKRIEF